MIFFMNVQWISFSFDLCAHFAEQISHVAIRLGHMIDVKSQSTDLRNRIIGNVKCVVACMNKNSIFHAFFEKRIGAPAHSRS